MGRTGGQRKAQNQRNRHLFIYERDGWTCMMPACLCPDGRQIDPELNGQVGHWAPSVDHIVPQALGGRNDRENLRAAHQYCNMRHSMKLSLLLSREATAGRHQGGRRGRTSP